MSLLTGTNAVSHHRFYPPLRVAAHLLEGKSLNRTLFNLALSRHKLAGKIVDLGSKNIDSSYFQFLQVQQGSELVFTDMAEGEGIVRLNVEECFPFENESFDHALAFNLFEHVYRYGVAPEQLFRILRPQGNVYVCVPFFHEYHADPEDYFRYTGSALRRIWEEAGFKCVYLEAIGEGLLTTCVTKLCFLLLPKPLASWMAALLYLLATPIDRLIALRPSINGKKIPEIFALAHLAIFQKNISL